MNINAKNKSYLPSLIEYKTIIFFDMDGTLIDTDYANFLSYKKAIHEVIGNVNIFYDSNKRFTRDDLKKAIPNIDEDQYLEIIKRKDSAYTEYICKTKIIKPTVDILNKYYNTNKTILVTNSRKERALQILNHHGLTGKFSDFIFKQYPTNSKIKNKFQDALYNLSLSSELVLAFENEGIEIENAQKAGIKTININFFSHEQINN